ncbi:speriolin isoform X8 [Acinonyx jubatus]|uniref:Speriolin isoform X8 n=1 Tax=Acinonyx jubatus TaxID=32536 RepID=A0ABM3NX75_ACIJB|nr:speriolin isoform X8 [Acinonyx jubatus]
MSLLANYEGLRHQIERLVRENEELKKLVRLIRENHELKSAIKTQAGGLGISGFSAGFGQMAATPQHQGNCVFLPPSPAAAHEPVLEEVGIVALAPLADMLNSPQPSPTAGPIVSPLTGPLSTLLPGPGPMSQSGLFSSILTGPLTPSSPLARPLAVAPGGTLGSSMGTVSTGPLIPSSTLAGLMAVSPRGTLGSSMGLPSTGPPTPSSPLARPLAVAPGGILGSSMGTASTSPLTPSSPLMAPTTGTVAISLSSPLLTSTAAPLGVSQNLVANPVSNLVLPEAQRVRLTEPFRGCPSGPHPSAGAGPAGTTKVNDPRGPRGTETSRKSMVELERKLAHRKISKFPDSPRESRQLAWERLVGEIAFQLDRRILSSIFPERVRLYGFTVSNIPEKIIQASLNPSDHKLDEELCQTLTQRYVGIMNRLQSLGYDGRVHPALTEQLVNAYGILRERPELAASEGGSYTVDFLQRVLVETVHPSMLTDALLLLSCLNQLAHDDGKPMFIW